jgi:hypothetical protein
MGALTALEIPTENRKVKQIEQAFLYNILEGVQTVRARKKKEREKGRKKKESKKEVNG